MCSSLMEREREKLETMEFINPRNQIKIPKIENQKPKIIVIMGATGSGKSRLAIDLASHLPIEIINADSMQVYQGLDVLTNKVSLQDQKGVPHHLLGSVGSNVEFTSKDFRDKAIQIINDIVARDRIPVIVGGTNFYIQALVSPFILDDLLDDTEDDCLDRSCGDEQPGCKFELEGDGSAISYDRLKEIDSDAANRIHPNDHRKVNQYLRLYARSGVLPSKIFQGKVSEKWGRADSFRYDCCFICVDASLPVLDKYVEQRVDCMMDAGLLTEVYEIYSRNADYTRGLRQAIGVREFEDFLRFHLSETEPFQPSVKDSTMPKKKAEILKDNLSTILDTSDSKHKILLDEAIDKLKTNTRRLVRRQKRRFNRLQALFGWNLHYVDATETLLGTSHGSWLKQVIEPSTQIIKSFLYDNTSLLPYSVELNDVERQKVVSRHLWTQFMCKACGNRILRGAHEWEQHQQGRGHRKRVQSLIKSKQFLLNSSPAPEPVSDFKTTAP